jgi:uncharacterized protein (TIGR02118 family)
MTILRVSYKYGIRFDQDYYLSTHLPIAKGVFGPHGLKNVEVMRITATPDGSKPPYQLIFSAYFESAAGLQNAMQSPQMSQVLADVPNYYDGIPDVLIGEVVQI